MKLSKDEQELVAQLFDKETEVVLDTLKELEEKGNEKFIEPLLEILSSNQAPVIKEKTTLLLQDMKNTKAMAQFLDLYLEDRFKKGSAYTFQVVWNAHLDASAHVNRLVSFALENDLQTALEASTILADLPGPFEEEHLLEGMIQCRTYLESTTAEEVRKPFIQDILDNLERMNREQ